jgi:hypothetical protein
MERFLSTTYYEINNKLKTKHLRDDVSTIPMGTVNKSGASSHGCHHLRQGYKKAWVPPTSKWHRKFI